MIDSTTDRTSLLLEVSNVTKKFPGVLALDGVSLKIRPGEVHALMGENGAGKSTLMKIIGGIHKANGGTITFKGQPYQPDGPADAQSKGVSLIHQELNLVPDLTAAQNIFLGREPMGKTGVFLSEEQAAAKADELLKSIGVTFSSKVLVRDLPVASQQMVEIAKAISFDSQLLVMDEPTAALTDREVDALFKLIHDFVSPTTAVIYISHRMEELMRISNRITVFRDGRFVKEVKTEETSRDEIVKLMVGRDITAYSRPSARVEGAPAAMSVRNITNAMVKDASFDVYPGEILGFGGLAGAGRTELARAIIGADSRSAGQVMVGGKTVDIRRPSDAVEAGIAYLSEDRKQYGLVLDKTIDDNVALASLKNYVNAIGWIRDTAIARTSKQYIDALSIKTPSSKQLVKNLSGGNQQKVVIAKWLARDCDVLIFDEPTRGIDVGAKQEIYELLDELAHDGHAIIVISSELEELLRVSDCILVMCNGSITGELDHSEATQENIMELATTFRK